MQPPALPNSAADGRPPSRTRPSRTRRDVAGPCRPAPAVLHQRSMRRDLSMALLHQHFLLYYQPRLSLGTGEPVGAEALLRWPHHRAGLISPGVFIPLAEQTGEITAMGGWVLTSACREAAAWPETLTVSVNVSARQLHDRALLQQVAVALEESALPPEMLEIELNESMLLDVDAEMLLTLSAIRDLGVGLALDDFGTGFASLAMLKRLPLTVMKLDRSLVRELPGDREEAAIVRAIIGLGHAFGLTVCAEGIETPAQRDFLAGSGCDEGQGYLFSHPLPAAKLRDAIGPM